MSPGPLPAIVLVGVMLIPIAGTAQEREEEVATGFSFRYSVKSSALLGGMPQGTPASADGPFAAALLRFRVEPQVRVDDRLAFDFAVDQRMHIRSSRTMAGMMSAPSGATAPFRVAQADWLLAARDNTEWRAEIDRAAVRLRFSRVELTVGRQAIGWGRGALFGAVDLFNPFSPLELDREWRRGVDAVRADVKVTDRLALDTVAAFDRRLADSTAAVRVRGYARRIDVELLGGYRAGDGFAGTAVSGAVGDMELHGDAALFRREDTTTVKAVVGGSYRIPLASGIFACAEYHYSGFGASSATGIGGILADPQFRLRYLRGDTQIAGRHIVAVLASYEQSPALLAGSQWLHSPGDGSGVLIPSVTYTIDDHWSALVSGYLPYGRGAPGASAREFSASPLAVFVQLRMYR